MFEDDGDFDSDLGNLLTSPEIMYADDGGEGEDEPERVRQPGAMMVDQAGTGVSERNTAPESPVDALIAGSSDRNLARALRDEDVTHYEPIDEEIDKIEESLDATWSVLTEVPGFDNTLEKAGDSLATMFDQFGYRPFVDFDDKARLYSCRYEFKQSTGGFEHTDGIVDAIPGENNIYLDFLTGFPLDCIEQLFMYGEDSSRYGNDERTSEKSEGPTPPVPKSFFEGYTDKRVLVNYTAMDIGIDPVYRGLYMADVLSGTPEPAGVKWWCRTNIKTDDKFPIPGEFVGLGVRMMPGEFSGSQQSSPFTFGGNWIDYVYYSSGKVIAVNDEGEIPTITVQWRKYTVTLKTTDYAQYAVGDRVTILKDVEESRDTQTWEDADAESANSDVWVVAPVMFYGMECRGD